MDLPEIGHICQYKYCGIRDFLPFFCERCNKYHCLKHFTTIYYASPLLLQ